MILPQTQILTNLKLTSALNSKIEGIQVPNGANYTDLEIENKKIKLSKIAKTGSIYDVKESNSVSEVKFLVLNCGSASILIDNESAI